MRQCDVTIIPWQGSKGILCIPPHFSPPHSWQTSRPLPSNSPEWTASLDHEDAYLPRPPTPRAVLMSCRDGWRACRVPDSSFSGLLAYLLAGFLASWPAVLLACWHPGLLACWPAGLLVCWPAVLLACWLPGFLACWPAGVLACWPAGFLACWPTGLMAC